MIRLFFIFCAQMIHMDMRLAKNSSTLKSEVYYKRNNALFHIRPSRKNGYIKSYSGGEETKGRQRTYYHITDLGNQYYLEKCVEWNLVKEIIDIFTQNRGDIMNQILDYIEVMFKSLPHTDEVEKLKMNMTDSMELKFNQYLEEGKRESEAIGLVIGEFGSIEELKEALGLNMNDDEGVIYLETPRVEEYLIFIKRFAMMISMGVAVIMVGIGATEYFDNLIIFFLSRLWV